MNTIEDAGNLPDDRLLTSQEAARYLGVSRQTVYSLHNAGHFPAVEISPGRTNWRLSDLRDYIGTRTRRVRTG
ncbi:AlpA family transcriptional regulator [Paracoccus sp. PAR01]|uniref:helix-turn-helix transcriptional regulator n=1 Tax=Paracoccus sp. PAR01 TaxID=2769282 RepID=UPI001784820C|nr:helix-turn-helix domain-containing protein [Paracoccus sp. PAR01]MBD9527848.1 helix-turn-helix domain-containing protein [Paracoccus sp. PAR01]